MSAEEVLEGARTTSSLLTAPEGGRRVRDGRYSALCWVSEDSLR
jgi:hypothetical protein